MLIAGPNSMSFSLPVLMYHSVSRMRNKQCVPPELFEEHCATLSQAGWRGISLAEAEGYFLHKRRLPGKTLLLTFDDGYLDNYVYAEPILRRYNLHGAIFPVARLLDTENALRPTSEASPPQGLPNLHSPATLVRQEMPVANILFCRWSEIRHMQEHGNLAAGAHSLRHDRVVSGLRFSELYTPGGRDSFFSVPPHPVLWGLPRFPLGYSLACRGYTLAPELVDLVAATVPQEKTAAAAFLADPANRKDLYAAIAKLPRLGTLESMEEYRARIFAEFTECRELFAERLGSAPLSFCWPWGGYSGAALEEARRAGFRVFFTARRGTNLPGGALAVRRIAVRKISGQDLLRLVRFSRCPLLETPYGWGRDLVMYGESLLEGMQYRKAPQ